jgi:hypothetical protein
MPLVAIISLLPAEVCLVTGRADVFGVGAFAEVAGVIALDLNSLLTAFVERFDDDYAFGGEVLVVDDCVVVFKGG